MGDVTPAEFAAKLERYVATATNSFERSIGARTAVMREAIFAAARAQNKGAREDWIKEDVAGMESSLRLVGGLAHLAELGSYHHPEGWEETATNATVLDTPYGPRASIMHPALRARHFWLEGVDAAREPGQRLSEAAIREATAATFSL